MDRRVAERMIAALEARLSLAEEEAERVRRSTVNALCALAGLPPRYPAARPTRAAAMECALAAVDQLPGQPRDAG
ncbi:MAG: hypothetical protein WB764_02365 [Xanthobacteraceae bacterium]|jgi:hypothetical protein